MTEKNRLSPLPTSSRNVTENGHQPWYLQNTWFVGITILLVLVITSLPYLYAYQSTPPDRQFMGIMLDVPDHVQYFSWMRELSTQMLSANKMTSEANAPVFFNLLWWMLGRIGNFLQVDYVVMFQFLRVSSIVTFLMVAFFLCTYFLPRPAMQKTAFLTICFTSGFGWILILIKYLTKSELLFPLDVFVAEGNTFLGMLGYPHFIAAALYIFVFYLALVGQEKQQMRFGMYGGLVALFLGWQHTYDLISVYGVLGFYTLLLWIRDRKFPWLMVKIDLLIGVLSFSPAVYSVLLTQLDPLWKDVLAQFDNAGVFTPDPLHLIILLGPAFLLAIFTVIKLNPFKVRQFDHKSLFLLSWFLITFVLIYLPVDYQIHLLNGWQVPIAILATRGLFEYVVPVLKRGFQKKLPLQKVERMHGAAERFAIIAFLLIIIPTNIYLWAWRFVELSRHDYPYYLSTAEVEGLQWLEEHVQGSDIVLSSLTIGQYVPALTGAHAYLAHWAQTVDFFRKTENVEAFFSSALDPAQRAAFLQQEKVEYIFWGPAERNLGNATLADIHSLKKVFSSVDVSIYQLQR